ncbi:intestinal mucin-like protein [Hemiscyllium ocellatum]|uniref:intestinal mucin-like protein n=1 Tax=Hemiscyllium ocellatum TaxID=170820 RepID=UPI0029661A2E|nr:intestinal mucin-like protein [Hemiscyllium ocellatum]
MKPTCYSQLDPISVPTEDGCCSTWDCNCNCEIWGRKHYHTFDGIYYKFLEDCAYVLVEEKVPRYNFSVILDNSDCNKERSKRCHKSLIINYSGHIINFSAKNRQKPIVTVDEVKVSFPYHAEGFHITKNCKKVTISIPDIRTTITGKKNNFHIQVPEQYFLDNTQGQCGSCSRNIKDECVRKNGKIEPDDCCHKTALDWKVDDPNKPRCQAAPTNVSCEVPPTVPPCESGKTVCDVLSGVTFKECNAEKQLSDYITACLEDHCAVNSTETDCSSLEAAAKSCIAAGKCVDWRNSTNGLCPHNCTEGFIYKACAKYNHDYCKDGEKKSGERFSEHIEGCFCENGLMLSEDETGCVSSCARCKDYAGNVRYEGDHWSHPNDTCIHYTCIGDAVTETKITCSSHPDCDEADKTWDNYRCCYSCPNKLTQCKVKSKMISIGDGPCSETIEVKACEGYCSSFAIFDPKTNGMKQTCDCCQEENTEEKQISLTCPNGESQTYTYISAKSCKCKTCKGENA